MSHRIAILYGSVRHHRKGIRVVHFLEETCRNKGWKVDVIDPLETPLPMLDKMYKEFTESEAPPAMAQMARVLENADGFLIVTGEYNHSIPPALKNLLDHFQKEYHFKPSAIAAYSAGHFGGARAAIQLRIILGELGTPSIPSILYFPTITKTVEENGTVSDERIIKSTGRFLNEFDWYLHALKTARTQGTP